MLKDTSPRIAFSVRQPWAFFIITGIKDVENRSWPCPAKYIGQRVFIHASKSPAFSTAEVRTILEATCPGAAFPPSLCVSATCTGGIVGEVTIAGCVRDSASPWATHGSYHWLLKDARMRPFRPCRGYLGFFTVPS